MKTQSKITVAEVRYLFQTSRKYAMALMEHLDEQKITKRVGDERVLRYRFKIATGAIPIALLLLSDEATQWDY